MPQFKATAKWANSSADWPPDSDCSHLRTCLESQGRLWYFSSDLRLATVAELFPEIIDRKLDREDKLPACSAMEALERQDPFINQTMAYHSLALLARLFRYGPPHLPRRVRQSCKWQDGAIASSKGTEGYQSAINQVLEEVTSRFRAASPLHVGSGSSSVPAHFAR
jgi:hypothetical protein